MSEPKRWQIHLSTAVIVMLVISILIGLNLSIRIGQARGCGKLYSSIEDGYGFPCPCYWKCVSFHLMEDNETGHLTPYDEHAFTRIEYGRMLVDLIPILVIAGATAAFCERRIRRREGRKSDAKKELFEKAGAVFDRACGWGRTPYDPQVRAYLNAEGFDCSKKLEELADKMGYGPDNLIVQETVKANFFLFAIAKTKTERNFVERMFEQMRQQPRVARPIPAAWLIKKLSVQEAEELCCNLLKGEYDLVKSEMQSSDEFWSFSSPPETFQKLAGCKGVALVRDSVPIDSIITIQN